MFNSTDFITFYIRQRVWSYYLSFYQDIEHRLQLDIHLPSLCISVIECYVKENKISAGFTYVV